MKVEDVSGEGLASRGTTKEEHDLPVSKRLLVEVVIHDDDVTSGVAEALAHRAASIGSEILHGGFVDSGG